MAGGKSFVLRWAALLYLIYLYQKYKIKHIPVGLFSEDYPTLKDRQITRIKREFPSQLGELKETKDEGLGFFLVPALGEGRIMLRNLDDPSKYMSTEFAGEFVEELTRNDEQTFKDIRNRLRYPGIPEVKFMGASNPGGIGHGWVKKYFIDQTTDDPEQGRFVYVHANVYDNHYISEDYVKQLESLPPQQRKAYLEGSWDVFAGQYFDEWSRNLHVIKPYMPIQEVIIGGMDWGRTKPFSFHLTQISKVFYEDTSFYRAKTFFEVYGTNKKPSEWDEEIKSHLTKYNLTLSSILWARADPKIFSKLDDGSKSIRDQFVDADSRWRTILRPANNDRISGWNILHDWLSIAPDGKPYWQITEECHNLIRTLPELIHDELHVEDVDTEGEDHAADDQRYQFKHVKWIDAKLGAVKENRQAINFRKKFAANMDDQGQQIAINLDRFAK